MNSNQILGFIWIIFSITYLVIGIQDIYGYSFPNIYWLYMIPSEISFSKVFLGLLCFPIGLSTVKISNKNNPILITFIILVLAYLLIDISLFGFEMIYLSGWNFILLLLSTLTISNGNSIGEIRSLIKESVKKKSSSIILLIGLLPYLFSNWIDYDIFNFLH